MAREKEYEFDDELLFDEAKSPVGAILKKILEVALLSFALAVVLYALFALVVNTDTETRLKRENRMYAKLYPELLPQESLLENSVRMLQSKDNDIYEVVFNSVAPSIDPIGTLVGLHGADTIPDEDLVFYTNSKAVSLCTDLKIIESNFREALESAARADRVLPPMSTPIDGITYTQVGASRGSKIDPVYNARVDHNGVDIIVPQGRTVKATADGFVVKAVKSSKGQGNVVEIRHKGGYLTRYCHLATISVSQGQQLVKGQKVGTVGSSGQTTAPHLHYEVKGPDGWMDPVNCFMGELDCDTYSNFMYMGCKTEKSLD